MKSLDPRAVWGLVRSEALSRKTRTTVTQRHSMAPRGGPCSQPRPASVSIQNASTCILIHGVRSPAPVACTFFRCFANCHAASSQARWDAMLQPPGRVSRSPVGSVHACTSRARERTDGTEGQPRSTAKTANGSGEGTRNAFSRQGPWPLCPSRVFVFIVSIVSVTNGPKWDETELREAARAGIAQSHLHLRISLDIESVADAADAKIRPLTALASCGHWATNSRCVPSLAIGALVLRCPASSEDSTTTSDQARRADTACLATATTTGHDAFRQLRSPLTTAPAAAARPSPVLYLPSFRSMTTVRCRILERQDALAHPSFTALSMVTFGFVSGSPIVRAPTLLFVESRGRRTERPSCGRFANPLFLSAPAQQTALAMARQDSRLFEHLEDGGETLLVLAGELGTRPESLAA
ncbi:hypothetical protein C8Q80DRAFT_479540 [Daedaleopsis nitida]|nr:hypothetical protein C8Q80DRAFT_479540 [Daedaleopsis nitida]